MLPVLMHSRCEDSYCSHARQCHGQSNVMSLTLHNHYKDCSVHMVVGGRGGITVSYFSVFCAAEHCLLLVVVTIVT